MKKIINIIFLIITILSMLEFLFIRGLFSGILMCILITIAALIQVIFNIKNKEYYTAILSTLICIQILISYYVIINY